MKPRPVDSLTAADFSEFPVWCFTGSDTPDETYVMPVCELPVKRLDGCVVGSQIRFADGTLWTGVLGNIDLHKPRSTEHFITLSVFRSDGTQFYLARYFDPDFFERGPVALAAFLGLEVSAIFPITYDISSFVIGVPEVARGIINAEPREPLSSTQLIDLAISREVV